MQIAFLLQLWVLREHSLIPRRDSLLDEAQDLATKRERQLTTARKLNNWLDQLQSGKLGTGNLV